MQDFLSGPSSPDPLFRHLRGPGPLFRHLRSPGPLDSERFPQRRFLSRALVRFATPRPYPRLADAHGAPKAKQQEGYLF